jgi:hypothetical protein
MPFIKLHVLHTVQVVIEAVDETGTVLSEAVSAGASAELTKDFTTGIFLPWLSIYYF